MILVFKMISIPFRVDTEDLGEKFKYLIFLKKNSFFQKIDIWCQKRQWSNFLKRKKSNELSLDKLCLGFSCKECTAPIFQSLNILYGVK